MKTAIYIENGLTQIVLTPENDFERAICQTVADQQVRQVSLGSFYECIGGFIRHGVDNKSTILVLAKKIDEVGGLP